MNKDFDHRDFTICEPLYVIVMDANKVCFLPHEDIRGFSQQTVTNSLDDAKKQCAYLRGMYPHHNYEILELSYKQVPYHLPNWNEGM